MRDEIKITFEQPETYDINLVFSGSIPEAPIDGKLYGRKDAGWGEVTGGGSGGQDGEDGASAYQIAVDNGFVGTEQEWLASLKGDNGDDGAQGIQGIEGEKGDKGDPGPQGPKGDKGDPAVIEITQITGTSETAVMSQKAVTDAIGSIENAIEASLSDLSAQIGNINSILESIIGG